MIAESFSGPIAAEIAKDKEILGLKAIMFVATFLSPPNRFLLVAARIVPLKVMNKLPGSKYIYQKLFFGGYATNQLLDLFDETINRISTKVLKERMKTMQYLNFEASKMNIPAAYLFPLYDKLVPKTKVTEFRSYFPNLEIMEIDGPHFILQTKPEKSADLIRKFINSLKK